MSQVWWVVVGTEPTPYDLVVELRTLRGAADLWVRVWSHDTHMHTVLLANTASAHMT